MNSKSKGYYDSCGKGKEEIKKDKCPTIIKCSEPDETTIPIISTEKTIATLKLDTSCLNDPCVKIDFTGDFSILSATNGTGSTIDATPATITLQLEKVCRHKTVEIGPARTITIPISVVGTIVLPIKFFACDCDCDCDCDDYCDWVNDCCIYRVTAILTGGAAGIGGNPAGTPASVSVTNTTLSTVATCRKSCDKKRHHGKCHQY